KALLLQLKSAALRRIPLKFSTHRLLSRSAPLSPSLPPSFPADTPALLTFTSGSTGQPKAALRTHGFLLAQHRALSHSLHLTPGETDLSTLPIFVLANLASGVTSLLPAVDLRYPGKVNARRLLRDIRRDAPTSTAASPALLDRLTAECEASGQKIPEFRRIFTGGAPVFPGLLQRLAAVAPNAQVTAVYGSTEAEPIAHVAYAEIQPDDLTRMTQGKGLLTGPPVLEIALRIVGDRWGTPIPALTTAEFDAQTLPAGAVGEIVVSGDHVLPGYLHGQGDAETKFRVDGVPWHRTGDAGYLDERGRLWLLGRCSAKLTDAWGTLYPFAVEAAAQAQPGIHRSALVAHRGQRVLLIEWAARFPDAARSPALQSLKAALDWAQIHQFYPCKIPVDKRHNAKVDYPAITRLLDRL
ncbi:MAG: AMP-binding protein, partial [Cyanobacteriota bacterium]